MLKRLTLCLLPLVLAACSAAGAGLLGPPGDGLVGGQLVDAAGVTLTPQGMLLRPITSQPLTPTPLPTLRPARVSSLVPPSQAPTLTPTPAPTATPFGWPFEGICSPLEFVALADLPRVMSDSYRPPLLWYSDARHPAVDFAYYRWKGSGPIAGTPAQAVLQGVVALAIRDSFPFGNAVIVETSAAILPDALKQEFGVVEGKSLYILYAHLDESSPEVVLGQAVSACETLGYVGKTGNAGAAHLHLETRLGPSGARFPEFSYYREEDSDEARVNYRYWSTSGNFRHFDPMRLLLIQLK